MAQARDGSHAELVRANQKDLTYLSQLRSTVTDIAQSILGVRHTVRWQRELSLAADLCYFGLTTCCGFQTLGEEYSDILQVDKSGPRLVVPSTLQRTAMILLHTFSPYLLDKCLARAQRHLSQDASELAMSEERRDQLLKAVACVRPAVDWLHRAHQLLFFLRGTFYHVAKRLVDVRFIAVPRGQHVEEAALKSWARGYRLMGYVMSAQLCLSTLNWLHSLWRSRSAASQNTMLEGAWSGSRAVQFTGTRQHSAPASNIQCALCLSSCQHATSTLCGHIFCWSCIVEACSNQPDCPLCREPCQASQLIYLRDFSGS